jgi:hypothetical protein
MRLLPPVVHQLDLGRRGSQDRSDRPCAHSCAGV